MNNIHALWDNLRPLNETDRNYFDGWKQRLNQGSKILWYPSAGGDFRDLFHNHPELWDNGNGGNGMGAPPDLFIHTDYRPDDLNRTLPRSCFQQRSPPPPWPSAEQGTLGLDGESQFLHPAPPPQPPPHCPVRVHDDGRTRIVVTRLVPLVPSKSIRLHFYSTWGLRSEENWLAGKAAFMELSIHSNKLGWFTRLVLYLFYDNCNFFNEFVLGCDLKISHLVHLCDGAGYGCGWVRMDFLHRFLGFMGVEYLITGYPFPTGTNRFLMQCRRARRVLNSPRNPCTNRIKLRSVLWSGGGSTIVYRVRPEPTVVWGRTRRRMTRARGASAARRGSFAGRPIRLAETRPA